MVARHHCTSRLSFSKFRTYSASQCRWLYQLIPADCTLGKYLSSYMYLLQVVLMNQLLSMELNVVGTCSYTPPGCSSAYELPCDPIIPGALQRIPAGRGPPCQVRSDVTMTCGVSDYARIYVRSHVRISKMSEMISGLRWCQASGDGRDCIKSSEAWKP